MGAGRSAIWTMAALLVVAGLLAARNAGTGPEPPGLAFAVTDSAPEAELPTMPAYVTATTTAQPRTATLVFTGDVLLHRRVNDLAAAHADADPARRYDYRPLLEPIADLVAEADWAVCHMEVNLAADGTRLHPYPRFRAPGQIAFDLADLGYDSCTTASNHTLDHGPDGVFETLDVLDAAGLHATGSARSPADALDRRWIEIDGIRIAHLAYTYWFNGLRLPDDMPWLSQEIDEERILTDAALARTDGADYVIVSLHWGEQYDNEPNRQQRDLAPVLAASPDIDLIIGHHAHVVQPIERMGETWVVYGLGNLLANYSQPIRRDELLVQVEITETIGGFETNVVAVPLWVDRSSLTVYPADANRPRGLARSLDDALDASAARTRAILWNGTR